jgi:uncharacterized protein YeeX (DUF496 family)
MTTDQVTKLSDLELVFNYREAKMHYEHAHKYIHQAIDDYKTYHDDLIILERETIRRNLEKPCITIG